CAEAAGPVAVLFEAEAYLWAKPLFGPVDHLPQDVLGGLKLENLHVEAAGAKAELEHAADLAFSSRVARPPAGKAFDRGQCLIDIVQRRRFDSDFMQDIRHIRFLLLVLLITRQT